jgi:hypothetical protein
VVSPPDLAKICAKKFGIDPSQHAIEYFEQMQIAELTTQLLKHVRPGQPLQIRAYFENTCLLRLANTAKHAAEVPARLHNIVQNVKQHSLLDKADSLFDKAEQSREDATRLIDQAEKCTQESELCQFERPRARENERSKTLSRASEGRRSALY